MRSIVVPFLLCLPLAGCATTNDGTALGQRSSTRVGADTNVGPGSTLEVTTYSDYRPANTEIGVAPAAVRAALPGAYAKVRIPLTLLDSASRTIGNRRFTYSARIAGTPMSNFVSCGSTATGAPVADVYRLQMSVVTSVQPVAAGSHMMTTVNASATPPGRSEVVSCTSSGRLEATIHREVSLSVADK